MRCRAFARLLPCPRRGGFTRQSTGYPHVTHVVTWGLTRGFAVLFTSTRRWLVGGLTAMVALLLMLTGCSTAEPVASGSVDDAQTSAGIESAEALADWLALSSGLDDGYPLLMTSAISTNDPKSLAQEVRSTRGEIGFAARHYPIEGSPVPGLLTDIAAARATALEHFDARRLTEGAAQTRRTAAVIDDLQGALLADVEQVEAQCGCRIDADGEILTGQVGREIATIVEWVDGDTVDTSEGRVRLIGVDTPEMDEKCAAGQLAKQNAEALAPPGSVVALVDPFTVPYSDKYGRQLTYVDAEGGAVDVGYSQILSDLAVARYDSQDGYQWHPRESAYRAASGDTQRNWLGCPPAGTYDLDREARDEYDHDKDHMRHRITVALGELRRDVLRSTHAANQNWRDHDALANDPSAGAGFPSGGGDSRSCWGRVCVG